MDGLAGLPGSNWRRQALLRTMTAMAKKSDTPKAFQAAARKRSRRPGVKNVNSVRTVEVADVGGYRVFGSPVKPVHVTEQQIQEALAAAA